MGAGLSTLKQAAGTSRGARGMGSAGRGRGAAAEPAGPEDDPALGWHQQQQGPHGSAGATCCAVARRGSKEGGGAGKVQAAGRVKVVEGEPAGCRLPQLPVGWGGASSHGLPRLPHSAGLTWWPGLPVRVVRRRSLLPVPDPACWWGLCAAESQTFAARSGRQHAVQGSQPRVCHVCHLHHSSAHPPEIRSDITAPRRWLALNPEP